MGEVYRARDPRLDRDVALKLLPEEFAIDRNRLKRFEQEARVVSTLSHPNIVTVYEIGEADGLSFIAMELVQGQTLRQLRAARWPAAAQAPRARASRSPRAWRALTRRASCTGISSRKT